MAQVSPEMSKLNEEAEKAGVLILNEVGNSRGTRCSLNFLVFGKVTLERLELKLCGIGSGTWLKPTLRKLQDSKFESPDLTKMGTNRISTINWGSNQHKPTKMRLELFNHEKLGLN